jgi:phenylpyruvate tautomerase PptA (4-oxalocrotonate tautomerase family)
MKTTTLTSLLIKVALLLMAAQASAQDLVGTRIDVQGARFSDQMWLFSVPSCTYSFDNGWDGYKMFGTSMAPQIFAYQLDGYYQVASVPNVNNMYIGFSAGVDTTYTLTFTHQNIANQYQQLFLIDSVANKTIDIYQTGTTYTFTALVTPEPVRRFKIVTSLPVVVIPPKDTIPVVIPPAPIDTIPVVVPPAPIVVNPPTIDTKNPKDKTDKTKKLKIYSSDKNIYIENPGKQKGKMRIIHAVTGRVVKTDDFNSEGTTIINANVPSGSYVVNGVTDSENVSTTIIIH